MHLFIMVAFALMMVSAALTATIYSGSAANPDSAGYRAELAQAERTVAEFNTANVSFALAHPGVLPTSSADLFPAHGFTPRAVAEGRSALIAGYVCYEPARHTPAALAAKLSGSVGGDPACIAGRPDAKGTVLVALQPLPPPEIPPP